MRILRHSLYYCGHEPMAKGGPALRVLSRSAEGKAAARLTSGGADASHQELIDGPADIRDLRRTVRSHCVSGMTRHTHQRCVRNMGRFLDRIFYRVVEVQFRNQQQNGSTDRAQRGDGVAAE